MSRTRCAALLVAGCLAAGSARAQPASEVRPSDRALHLQATAVGLRAPGAGLAGTAESETGLSRRAVLEMAAVGLTGVGHLAFSAAGQSRLFIPIATAGWGGYVYYRARTDPAFLGRAGFTSRNLGTGFRDASLVALGAAGLMAGVAAAQGTDLLERDMVPLLLLYPAWGLVQQFLVQGMMARHLSDTPGWTGSPFVVTAASASLFGAVHAPNWKLTAATFVMGLAFTPLYLRHENLWPLGLYHGWLGVLFYFWVLDRNPLRKLHR